MPRPKACSLNDTVRHADRAIAAGRIQSGSPTSRQETVGAVYANGASATSYRPRTRKLRGTFQVLVPPRLQVIALVRLRGKMDDARDGEALPPGVLRSLMRPPISAASSAARTGGDAATTRRSPRTTSYSCCASAMACRPGVLM
jgi:hypothetical protein